MYIESVPNRSSPPAILLRESFRQDGRVCKRTIANLSDWPMAKVNALKAVLAGGTVITDLEDAFDIIRSRPHGHVAAVLGVLRQLHLDDVIEPHRCCQRDLVVGMIVARIISPRSKLATARGIADESLTSTLGETLEIQNADEDALYSAMDWLLERQGKIEEALAQRHLHDGTFVLYDVTSTYFEGKACPLAKLGHNRDGKKDKLQVVVGLLCDPFGRPVAVEVFPGNTGDPTTLSSQVNKVKERFGIKRAIVVADRGLITDARIREDLKPEHIDWISALRAPAIRKMVESGDLQLTLFDTKDLAEITSSDFPDERLVACFNPFLSEKRARKRESLLVATEKKLDKIVDAAGRKSRPLTGKDRIGIRVGKVIDRAKMGKHFKLFIDDKSFRYERDLDGIKEEAALDGIYVVRTSLKRPDLPADEAVATYKHLSDVERAFRSIKTLDLKIRPIYHHLEDRVRAHVLLCMLAYYVEWHLRERLAPILFDDDDKIAALQARVSPVAPAVVSPSAQEKAATKRTPEGLPVHSFQTLLADLATICRNRVRPRAAPDAEFDMNTVPTTSQQHALDLMRVSLKV